MSKRWMHFVVCAVFACFLGASLGFVPSALAGPDVEPTVRELVAKHASAASDKVTREAILEELGLDELAMVELILDLEDVYRVELKDEDVKGLKSFGELVDYVRNAVAPMVDSDPGRR